MTLGLLLTKMNKLQIKSMLKLVYQLKILKSILKEGKFLSQTDQLILNSKVTNSIFGMTLIVLMKFLSIRLLTIYI